MIPNKIGLEWRINLARECWFYFRACKNWRSVILTRLYGAPLDQFHLRTGLVVALCGDPPWSSFREIWGHQIYTRKYPPAGIKPNIIVDIGANIGLFALFVAHRWPQAKVFAYEPAPSNFALLHKNIQLNNATQISLRSVAIAGSLGERTLYLQEGSEAHSLWSGDAQSTIQVQTVTLDEIIAEVGPEPIDLMKIDCEGAEFEMLTGREELLAKHVRFIAMEYHELTGHRVDELRCVLERAGFACEIHPWPRWRLGMLYGRNKALSNTNQDYDWTIS